MRLPDVRSLDPDARARIRAGAQRLLAHFRGSASHRTREFARRLVAAGRVAAAEVDGEGARASFEDGEGAIAVRITWTDVADARCDCAAFLRSATCPHVVALLERVLAALEAARRVVAPEAKSPGARNPDAQIAAPRWLARLEELTRAIEGTGPSPPPLELAAAERVAIRYALRFTERRGSTHAVLECQARRDGGGRRWQPVPFAGARAGEVDLAHLGSAHASVAAIVAGAQDATWQRDPTQRGVALAAVDRSLARPLLLAAERAAPLVLVTEARAEPLPLDLALDGMARLEIEADDEAQAKWCVRAWLRGSDGERTPASSVVAVSADGVCALRGTNDRARVLVLAEATAASVVADLAREPLEIPRSEASSLSAVAGAATLVGDELAEVAAPPRPVPWLTADAPLDVEGKVRVECEIEFDYGGTRVRSKDRARVLAALDGRSIPRQPRFEAQALERLAELGGRLVGRPAPDRAEVEAARFLGLVGTLVDEGWRVVARDQVVRRTTRVDVSVSSGIDWFDLVGGVSFEGQEVSFPRALEAARRRRGIVELGDGSKGLLPETWLERWRIASLGEQEGEGVRFDRTQGWVLAALVREREAEVDEPFRELRRAFKSLGAPRPADPPPTFRGELRPYQREGLGWLLALDEVGLSGCLADDMGLGKTVQLLAYLEARAARAEGRHSLVVAPRSLIFNWLGEAARFVPQRPTIDFTGPRRWERLERAASGSLLVTTYGALRRDAERLSELEFDALVLDEAQAIKSRASQTTLAARALRARRRVTLTGTPVENHLGELWSQLEFLNPGMLGSHAAFERLGAPRARHELTEEARDLLARALRPFLLRRSKDAVLKDLPPKTEQVLRVPLAGEQRNTYEELARHYRTELVKSRGQRRREREEDPGRDEVHVLAALTRLRQAACHPGLVDPTQLAESSGKLDVLLPRLEELVAAGRKAIVFSSFTRLLGLVRTRLETSRIPYHVLEGRTRNRGAVVDAFQKRPDGCVFLISIQAGGAGLNLTAADVVFLLDPWWNPALESQAIDRAHRIGQTRPVHVYRVLTDDTIEARVVELQGKKSSLARATLEGAATTLADLEPEDLAFLLS